MKTLAFEPATKRDFLGNTGHALIFESDNSDIFATRLVPNNISGLKIDVHCVPLGEVTVYTAGADHITAVMTETALVDVRTELS